MTPFVQDADFTLYVGDVRDCLRELPAESVHTCVTSPPYWGLRDYGTGLWDGGDETCDHVRDPNGGNRHGSYAAAYIRPETGKPTGGSRKQREQPGAVFHDVCGKCGATRVDQQLGLEPTPELFVAAMVDVFREVRRVLRSDGTLWLNLGDSYAGSPAGNTGERRIGDGGQIFENKPFDTSRGTGLKQKDLCGIPWRVAFALQADGWYLRSDIIWAKPNPMPESVTDRPTKAHEYLFLLSKSPRYFFDQEAVREAMAPASEGRYAYAFGGAKAEALKDADEDGIGVRTRTIGMREPTAGRNLRSVWEIATQPYPDAHFATFPEALPDRCIRAGSSERGCCPECGAPWVREVEDRPVVATVDQVGPSSARYGEGLTAGTPAQYRSHGVSLGRPPAETTGWRRNCDPGCVNGGKFQTQNPCVVLDSFMGSGTTALVARRLGRRSIGVELNESYAALCARRLQQLSLLNEVGS